MQQSGVSHGQNASSGGRDGLHFPAMACGHVYVRRLRVPLSSDGKLILAYTFAVQASVFIDVPFLYGNCRQTSTIVLN